MKNYFSGNPKTSRGKAYNYDVEMQDETVVYSLLLNEEDYCPTATPDNEAPLTEGLFVVVVTEVSDHVSNPDVIL